MDEFNLIIEKIQSETVQSESEILLIGVCGEYASGKTTLTKNLSPIIENRNIHSHTIESDMYFLLSKPHRQELFEKLKKEGKYDSEFHRGYSLDESLMAEHLKKIEKRENIHSSGLYQRETGIKNKTFTLVFKDGVNYIMYDGVWVANPLIMKNMDHTIYVTSDMNKRQECAKIRALESGESYIQTPERFLKLDKFVNDYINGYNPRFNTVIDNTDFDKPRIIR